MDPILSDHPLVEQLESSWPVEQWQGLTVVVAVSGGADSVGRWDPPAEHAAFPCRPDDAACPELRLSILRTSPPAHQAATSFVS